MSGVTKPHVSISAKVEKGEKEAQTSIPACTTASRRECGKCVSRHVAASYCSPLAVMAEADGVRCIAKG